MKIKKELNNLAIFGGRPLFEDKLHVGRPNMGDRERLFERINDILDRRWLTNEGKYVQEFEKKIARLLDVKHCIAMCNGTIALEIASRALGFKGEVIMPAMTFVATAHALQWQQITPVFCDVDPVTFCIDPSQIEKLITPRTTGIIGVHVFGWPCETEALRKIAERHGLKLLFDAAHAFGCSKDGKMIGGFGDAEVLSFHATKVINTFEGGAVMTNDDHLAEKIRLMKNFGFKGLDNVIYLGINGKMNEISAAMGLTSLESFDKIVDINKVNYKLYKKYLSDIPGISLHEYNEIEKCNYQYVVLSIDKNETGLSRDELLGILRAENILCRRYFYPGCHKMEPYRSQYPDLDSRLPVTERVCQQLIQLPTGSAIGSVEIEQICDLIRMCLTSAGTIHELSLNGACNGR